MESKVLDSLVARLRGAEIPVQKIVIKENQVFTLTVKELRAVANGNRKHPIAEVFLNAVEGDPEDLDVHVDRVDLEALIQDRPVVIDTDQQVQVVDGKKTLVTTERKTLGGGPSATPTTAMPDGQ